MPDTPDLSRFTDALAGLLADHEVKTGIRDMRTHCRCGWSVDPRTDSLDGPSGLDLHRRHVAALIGRERANARAEGVREGAARVAAAVEAELVVLMPGGSVSAFGDSVVRAALAESTDPEETR